MLPYILKSIRQLECAKANFIVLPCNTLHTLLPILRKKSKTKFLDLIEEVSKEIKNKYKKIGILSTTKTKQEKLYDTSLKNKIEIIYPTNQEQRKVSKIIIKILRKKANKTDKKYLENLIKKLINRGAEKVILACTDLTNLIKYNKNIVDTMEILINSILREIKFKS